MTFKFIKEKNLSLEEAKSFQSFTRDKSLGFGLPLDKAFELWSKKWDKKTFHSVMLYACKFFDAPNSINEIKKWGEVREIKDISSSEEVDIFVWLFIQVYG